MTLVFFFITHFNFVTVFTISSLTYTLESNSTILTQLHSTLLVRHPFFFTSTGFCACDPLAQVHLHHVQHLHSLTTACSCTWKTNQLQKHLHLATSTGTCTCTCPPTSTCATLAHSLEDSQLAIALALVHQNLPIAWRTHHLHSGLARITGNISLLRGNP